MNHGLLRRATGCVLVLWLALGPVASASAQDGEVLLAQADRKRGGKKGRASRSKPEPKPAAAPAAESDDSDLDLDLGDEPGPKPSPPPARVEPVRIEPVRTEPSRTEPARTEPVRAKPEPARAKPEPEPEPEAEPEADEAAEAASEEAAPSPGASEEAPEGPSVVIEPYAGFGFSTRSVRLPEPMGAGTVRLAPSPVPAAEVGLRVVLWPSSDLSLVINLVYQSALGFTVTEPPPLALRKEVRARSERVALDVAPRWRFGNLTFAVPIGATIRTLWPEVHESLTPGFSLIGPHAQAELTFYVTENLFIRVAPELQFIMLIDQELRQGGVSSQGFALGGDVSVTLRLSQTWSIGINYRESHALLSTSRSASSFEDVERYLTLRVTGSF